MVEYSKLTLTKKGAELNAKMIAGQTGFTFTKVRTSDTAYEEDQLIDLTSLSGIKQTALVSKVERTNDVTINIEVAFNNMDLSVGYFMRTLGLYALDPSEGEILYAVSVAASDNCYMPPNNGVTSTGAFIKLVQTVGNADKVDLNVDPAAVATIADIQALNKSIEVLTKSINNINNKISDYSMLQNKVDHVHDEIGIINYGYIHVVVPAGDLSIELDLLHDDFTENLRVIHMRIVSGKMLVGEEYYLTRYIGDRQLLFENIDLPTQKTYVLIKDCSAIGWGYVNIDIDSEYFLKVSLDTPQYYYSEYDVSDNGNGEFTRDLFIGQYQSSPDVIYTPTIILS